MKRSLDVVGPDGLRFGDVGGEEGVMGEAVRLAGEVAASLVDRLDGGEFEEWDLVLREAKPIGEVGPLLVRANVRGLMRPW